MPSQKCQACNQSFTSSSRLSRHVQSHHVDRRIPTKTTGDKRKRYRLPITDDSHARRESKSKPSSSKLDVVPQRYDDKNSNSSARTIRAYNHSENSHSQERLSAQNSHRPEINAVAWDNLKSGKPKNSHKRQEDSSRERTPSDEIQPEPRTTKQRKSSTLRSNSEVSHRKNLLNEASEHDGYNDGRSNVSNHNSLSISDVRFPESPKSTSYQRYSRCIPSLQKRSFIPQKSQTSQELDNVAISGSQRDKIERSLPSSPHEPQTPEVDSQFKTGSEHYSISRGPGKEPQTPLYFSHRSSRKTPSSESSEGSKSKKSTSKSLNRGSSKGSSAKQNRGKKKI